MASTIHTRTFVRRFTAAACLAAGAAVGSLGLAATAAATWDIEAYDDCIRASMDDNGHVSNTDRRICCEGTGGVWHAGDFGTGICIAPAEVEQPPAPQPKDPIRPPVDNPPANVGTPPPPPNKVPVLPTLTPSNVS